MNIDLYKTPSYANHPQQKLGGGGGFKQLTIFVTLTPNPGEMIQFDIFFQMGGSNTEHYLYLFHF